MERCEEVFVEDLASFKMGDVEDFSNFINAVIDEKSFDKIGTYIANAKKDKNATIVAGGKCDKSKGYFIQPTVIKQGIPIMLPCARKYLARCLRVYVYDDKKVESTLSIVDKTSGYALTGAIFANDRNAVLTATRRLTHAAGNFYINDKPTVQLLRNNLLVVQENRVLTIKQVQ